MNRLEEALKLLPYSLQSDPVVMAMFEATIIQLQELYDDALLIFDLVNISKLPEELLDLIAFEKHVDFYDSDLSLEQKRALVKSNISWHRKKGTRWALEHVVSIVMPNSTVSEWFEYEGRPYFFRLETEQALSPNTNFKQIVGAVNNYKNARSWLENITVNRKLDLGLNIGAAYPLYQQTKITVPKFEMDDLQSLVSTALINASYKVSCIHVKNYEMPDSSTMQLHAGLLQGNYKRTQIDIPHFAMPDRMQVPTLFGGVFSAYKKTTILAMKG